MHCYCTVQNHCYCTDNNNEYPTKVTDHISIPKAVSVSEAASTSVQSSDASCQNTAPIEYKPVGINTIKNDISLMFETTDIDKLHNHETRVENSCCSLSPEESKKLSIKKDKFNHAWLFEKELAYCHKTGYW